MRYFYYLSAWLACWLAAPALARASSMPSTSVQLSSTTAQADPSSQSEQTVITTRVPLRFPNSNPASLSKPNQGQTAGSAQPAFGIGAMSTKSAVIHLIGQPTPAPVAANPVMPPPAPSHSLVSAEIATPKLTIASPSAIIAYKARVGPPVPEAPANPFAHKGVTLPYAENFAQQAADAAKLAATNARHELSGRLARLTAYWAGEGDYYTGKHLASTGIHLHGGVCAVDPSIIPYGSVVVIPGLGQFLAADTGSAVISRAAAREAGRTLAERSALVIDIFFEDSSEGQAFAAQQPKFVSISWWTPSSTSQRLRRRGLEQDLQQAAVVFPAANRLLR